MSCPLTAAPSREHSPGINPGDAWHEFSPDGTKVMLNLFGKQTLLIDVQTGEAESLPDSVVEPSTWQRQAL
jgi:hypothetical protein